MSSAVQQKVSAGHLRRNAYLYVRQSTMRQVFENTESTQRQYALRQRAVTLGWPNDRVIVIDSDLGVSGAGATDREGFQKLVAEVGLGHNAICGHAISTRRQSSLAGQRDRRGEAARHESSDVACASSSAKPRQFVDLIHETLIRAREDSHMSARAQSDSASRSPSSTSANRR
jgi:hypothetical protein